jgi:hypothetical protein
MLGLLLLTYFQAIFISANSRRRGA